MEDKVRSPKAYMCILDSLINKNSNAYIALVNAKFADDNNTYSLEEFRKKIYGIVGNVKGNVKQNIDKAIELEGERQNPEAFEYILDNYIDRKKAAFKKIMEIVKAEFVNNSNSSNTSRKKNLSPTQLEINYDVPCNKKTDHMYFYNGGDAWELIENIIPHDSKEKIKKDLEWFLEQMCLTPSKRKYYQDIDATNNEKVIDLFCHLKEKEKNGKPQAPYFTSKLRNEIRNKLLSIYCANR